LSKLFPGINFTVCSKADSKFKIVGAASVAAKVTRDACLEGWVFEENAAAGTSIASNQLWTAERGSGYPSGVFRTFLSWKQICDAQFDHGRK
jgi:ribonuclease H2 subunit A